MADPPDSEAAKKHRLDFLVVGVGASAGGIAALKTLLEAVPAEPEMAFVVILHLSPTHASSAAEILQTSTAMTVTQVSGRTPIERNHVYLIPPTWGLAMADGCLDLCSDERKHGRHVVVDEFFRTLADAHGTRAAGVILSGTGADGSVGIARLKEAGGVVFAQSPDEAEYDGMPCAAIATGKVDTVLPVAEIATRLVELWKNSQQIEIPDSDALELPGHDPEAPAAAEAALRDIMVTLHQRTGHDFRHYKRATVLRRIERRLQVNRLPDLVAYRRYLLAEPGEARALLDDLLIGVTEFFRDRGSFEALARDVMPRLVKSAGPGDAVRAWVAGCSTGEEAFSVAILLAEEVARQRRENPWSVFATDIDANAIALARAGRYSEAIAGDVSPERLRANFSAERGGYRIHKSLRENVIFAEHNVLRDPAFSRVDLVSCRNLLIYLDRAAQHQVLEAFHFALKPGGHLFLGSSESVDGATRLFSAVDTGMRIYRANPVAGVARAPAKGPGSGAGHAHPPLPEQLRGPTAAEVHRRLVEELAPPSVLVTADHEIVHVSAGAARFLRYAEGEPSSNLLDSVAPDLRPELRTLLVRAEQLRQRVEAPLVHTQVDGHDVRLRMSAMPARHPAWPNELLLVSLNDTDVGSAEAAAASDAEAAASDDPKLARAHLEVKRRGDELHATIERYESSSEQLKASNEELHAINEELRSASEELETSKEELVTVNQELKLKIEETSEANDDLRHLIASTDIATVFVDQAMRIKRYTPAAATIFNIIESDIGRSLFDITHKLDFPTLADDARRVFTTLKTIEREVSSTDGRRLLSRLLPYRTAEDKIAGAVLTFVDVTTRRRAQTEKEIADKRMQAVADTMTDFAIVTLDAEGTIVSWSAGAVRVFGYAELEALGSRFDMLFPEADRAAGAPQEELRTADASGRASDERWMQRKDGTDFYASGVTMVLVADDTKGYAKICRDMTGARHLEELHGMQLSAARQSELTASHEAAMKNEFLAVMSHELKHPLNLISVNAQLLATLPEAQALPQVARAAKTIQRTVMTQGRIIDDLLDMSRLHTGKLALNRAPVLVVETMQSALNWALGESRSRGVHFYAEGLDEAMLVDGDPVRIEQIAWNLLTNAVKFTPSGGQVTVRLSAEGGDAVLEVADTGKGITEAFAAQMFQMFKQADIGTARVEGGLGIGLALVKQLAELHGGSVAFESAGPGRGSTFRVRLPLHQHSDFAPHRDAAPSQPEPAADDGPPRVLLVDDSADALESLQMLLELSGLRVKTAPGGAAALVLLEQEAFDVIVSDVGMPGMDGYQLMRRLRGRPATARLPGIALTGYGRDEDREMAFAAGFQAHADKPVDSAHLIELIAGVRKPALAR